MELMLLTVISLVVFLMAFYVIVKIVKAIKNPHSPNYSYVTVTDEYGNTFEKVVDNNLTQ